jgi:hypothetical protein
MAPPQAQQLLEAATERVLPSAPENEEDTVVAASEFRAGDNGPVDALLGTLRQPARSATPANELAASAPDSEPPSSARRPAALRRDPEPGPEPVDLFGAAAVRAGSEAEQREQQIAAEQFRRAAPASAREDAGLTGARHETSVLFSLDQLAKKEPAKPKRPQRPQESEADFLMSGSAPNAAHPGFAPVMTAPDFNAPPAPSVQSSPPSAPAPAAEKKGSNAGLWALLGFLVVGGLGAAGYFYVKQRSAQTAPTFEPAPVPPPRAAVTGAPTPTAPATATTPATATATPPTAPVATDTAAPPTTDPKAPAAARPAAPRPGAVAPKPPAPSLAPSAAAQAPPAATGAPFNRDAAAAALASAAATAASSCAQPDGPTGSGKVTVTFSPTGRATQALVGGDFAGTSVGGCIAKVFRQATIPPFSGQPTTVAKTVRVP